MLTFDAIAHAILATLDGDQLDVLPFGVVGLSPEGWYWSSSEPAALMLSISEWI